MKPGDLSFGPNFLHIGSILIQWGTAVATPSSQLFDVALPIPYANTSYIAQLIEGDSTSLGTLQQMLGNNTTTSFRVRTANNNIIRVNWLTIGSA
jgi:hypothetical protein